MKVVVTGGAGFIGSHLVAAHIEAGASVTVIDDFSTGQKLHPAATFYQRDVADGLPDIEADYVFHLAALSRIQPSFADPIKAFTSNSIGTAQVLEFARRTGAKVIYPGTSACGDIYANPYSYTKTAAEGHCVLWHRLYGVKIGLCRFFNVYGDGQAEEGAYANVVGIFKKQKREGRALTVTGTGEQRRDFVHVSDIVNGLVRVAAGETGEEVYQLGTGRSYAINEVASMFGGNVEYIPARPGEEFETRADISYARWRLGYGPLQNLEDYIKSSQ